MANASDVAAQYGYSAAFFNADPELKQLLNSATSGNWTPAQFVAKLQATKWFRTNGEAARQIFALKTSDPATYNQRVTTATRQVYDTAQQMGSNLTGPELRKLAENALAFGWSDGQIRSSLSAYIKADGTGAFRGDAAKAQRAVRDVYTAYGYGHSDESVATWTKWIAAGSTTIDQLKEQIINITSSRYPQLAERLAGGETMEDIAAPYRDSYSRVLEVPAGQVSLTDNAIQKALSAKDKKGKPTTQTVWQFEQDLKQDPRWLQTKNAQSDLVGNTRKVLADFGLVN